MAARTPGTGRAARLWTVRALCAVAVSVGAAADATVATVEDDAAA
jgi:hypothetical protein